METRFIVSAIVENGGKFLFGKKPDGRGHYPGTWHLIGGGLEQGESLTKAVKREIKEEAGIEIQNIEPASFDEDCELNKHGMKTRYTFLVFKADYKSGKLKPSGDIAELKWIEKPQLSKTKLNRPTIKLFKKLELI